MPGSPESGITSPDGDRLTQRLLAGQSAQQRTFPASATGGEQTLTLRPEADVLPPAHPRRTSSLTSYPEAEVRFLAAHPSDFLIARVQDPEGTGTLVIEHVSGSTNES
jgi:hypothetical protein